MESETTAVAVPLLHLVEHDGTWRRVVGTTVNLQTRIVSMSFENWGGVVDYPMHAPVVTRNPQEWKP